jgi:twitching motility protein PilI
MSGVDIATDGAPVEPADIDVFEVLAAYEQRSLAHVAGLPEQLQAAGLWRGIGFRIGQRRLVSSYEAVAEILTVPQITPVPGAHSWMLGVANVRSNLLPVVDLKQFLEGTRSVLHEGHQKVMVLRQPGGDVAVTIDELYGQRSFMEEQQIEADGLADGRYAGFVERAYRVADGVWGVFNLDRLVRTPEFRHAAV